MRITESYGVAGEKHPKVRILQNLGCYDELETKGPGIVEGLKGDHRSPRESNQAARQGFVLTNIRAILEGGSDPCSQGFPLANHGVKVLASLWNDLDLDYFIDHRRKTISIDKKIEKAKEFFEKAKTRSDSAAKEMENLMAKQKAIQSN